MADHASASTTRAVRFHEYGPVDLVRDTFPEAPVMGYDAFPEFARLAAAGQFTVPIAAAFPLPDWRAAMEVSLAGHAYGKLLLLP